MDIDKITLSDMAMAKLDWASKRARVIAQNVANADTPGYKAQDLDKFTFKDALRAATSVAVARTHPQHLKGTIPEQSRFVVRKIKTSEESPDGNNVVLEEQMQKISDAKGAYSTAVTLMSAEDRLMKLAIGKTGS